MNSTRRQGKKQEGVEQIVSTALTGHMREDSPPVPVLNPKLVSFLKLPLGRAFKLPLTSNCWRRTLVTSSPAALYCTIPCSLSSSAYPCKEWQGGRASFVARQCSRQVEGGRWKVEGVCKRIGRTALYSKGR